MMKIGKNKSGTKSILGRKILVTGAGGFIGSHLTEKLIRSGAEVTALVRYTSSGTAGFIDRFDRKLINKLQIVYGDIRNRDDVIRAIGQNEIILHLAAQIAIPYSYLAPGDFLDVNAGGSLNILTVSKNAKVKRIVLMSTSEVYGSAQYVPIDEKHPQVAQSPYSASKIAADKLAESFHLSFNTPVVIARAFNTYGPRQSARAVIPTIILQALRGKIIRLGNIETRRDLNYVGDTADALIKIGLSRKGAGQQFNICTGTDYSIGELVEMVGEILGKKLIVKTESRRTRPKGSEVDRLLGDGTKGEKLFGLGKKISLKSGLTKTIAWFEKNEKMIKKEDYQL